MNPQDPSFNSTMDPMGGNNSTLNQSPTHTQITTNSSPSTSHKFEEHFQFVNALWLSSLVLSLTCALLAISLQQWARRYLVAVRQRRTPHSQARIRGYLAEGVRDSGIVILVDLMRTGQQLSFVLFATGLLVPLSTRNVNQGYYAPVIILIWLVLCVLLYLCMIIVGILRPNSPYYTPLLSFMRYFPQLIFATPDDGSLRASRFKGSLRRFTRGARKETELEELTLKLSQGLDRRNLEWTFDSLNQDHEFERFFAGIPDFCNSRAVKDPMGHVLNLNGEQKLSQALIGFIHRTVTSHLISEQARQQRITICMMAMDAVSALTSWSTLRRVFGEWEGLLGSVDFGSALLRTGGDRNGDPLTVFCTRCIVATVIARAQVYDGAWFDLTTQFLTSDMEVWVYLSYFPFLPLILYKVWVGISPTLRSCLEHGHSALVANLIFIARITFQFHSEHSRDKLFDVSSRTLSELCSNIDVRLASSDVQHEFCGLWNDLVHLAQAQNGTGSYAPATGTDILRHLRKSYIALHESTDASLFYTSTNNGTLISLPGSSYPLCSVQDHPHASPQTPHLTTANLANLPPSHSLLTTSPYSIHPNAVTSATEEANDTSSVLSPAEVASDLAASLSAPTPPPPTLVRQLENLFMEALSPGKLLKRAKNRGKQNLKQKQL